MINAQVGSATYTGAAEAIVDRVAGQQSGRYQSNSVTGTVDFVNSTVTTDPAVLQSIHTQDSAGKLTVSTSFNYANDSGTSSITLGDGTVMGGNANSVIYGNNADTIGATFSAQEGANATIVGGMILNRD